MMKNTLKTTPLFLALFLFILPFNGNAQRLADTLKKIDALFVDVNTTTPGAAIAVSRGNKVIYSKGFGIGDLEHNIPISPETIFEAGSVSKQFTSTSILLLVQEGKVNLDDEVQKYIPEVPRYEHKITVRHLLNHTSGLRDWGVVAELGGWPRGTRVYTNDAALAYILKQKGLNNIPGGEYLYSNSNYTLLTFIVERVSGKKLPEFVKERIFLPLGMKNSSWRDNFQDVVKNRAIGYDKTKTSFTSNMPFENTYGHAALLTNVIDLDIWNKSWKNSPLGDQKLLDLRVEQGILNNGDTISYAGGVMIDTYRGHDEVSHSGATAGYRCWTAYYPNDQLSVVYLSNATNISTSKIGKGLASIFFGEESPTSKTPEKSTKPKYNPDLQQLKRLEGTYYSKECDGKYTIKLENDSLWIYDRTGSKKVLQPDAELKFFTNSTTTYRFKEYGENKQFYISVPRARNVEFEKLN